jgi:hypothetical protein
MRVRCMGKGASLGEEAVLADSGRVGEEVAGIGWVKRTTFSSQLETPINQVLHQ